MIEVTPGLNVRWYPDTKLSIINKVMNNKCTAARRGVTQTAPTECVSNMFDRVRTFTNSLKVRDLFVRFGISTGLVYRYITAVLVWLLNVS